jgi:hypothetical protein
MPAYPHLLEQEIDFDQVRRSVNAMALLQVPYTDEARDNAPELARAQGRLIAEELVAQNGMEGLESKKVIALIAYLQRLGLDIDKTPDWILEVDLGDGVMVPIDEESAEAARLRETAGDTTDADDNNATDDTTDAEQG